MKIVTGIIVAALIGGGYGWKLHKDSEAASAAAGDDDTVAVAPWDRSSMPTRPMPSPPPSAASGRGR